MIVRGVSGRIASPRMIVINPRKTRVNVARTKRGETVITTAIEAVVVNVETVLDERMVVVAAAVLVVVRISHQQNAAVKRAGAAEADEKVGVTVGVTDTVTVHR